MIHPELARRLAAEHVNELLAEAANARLARAVRGRGQRRQRHLSARRTETQSIECDAPRERVVGLLAQASRIPEWAPSFVDQVRGDPLSGWQATKGGHDFALRVLVDNVCGTVDYLREIAPGREGGAYLRTVPRPGGGSVIGMTVPVNQADRIGTITTLTRELDTLVALLKHS